MRRNNPQDPDIQTLKDNVADFKKEAFSTAAQQFQKLGKYKEPALVVGGLAAAVGTAAVAKKLFQKAEQKELKEDPYNIRSINEAITQNSHDTSLRKRQRDKRLLKLFQVVQKQILIVKEVA